MTLSAMIYTRIRQIPRLGSGLREEGGRETAGEWKATHVGMAETV